ncbi:MAG: T9SS type A sorting domain-containing protein, partial [Crocinitomicaceae bacterium]|nr:T9SS type A sorting domain-containing protein [Crocinitomicaceae bacterium]
AIDLVQVETCITCPAPNPFNIITAGLISGDFDWTENGSATEWELEWGTPGFTPGAGTTMLTSNNPETVGGLTSNSFYEIYVQSVCAPGDTSALTGPILFNTYNQGIYMDGDTDCPTSGFVDISATGTATGLTDDGTVNVTLPFSLLYQGTIMTTAFISNNGAIELNSPGGIPLGGIVSGTTDDGLYPFWDDLDSETGDVYYETIGTTPSQVFIVQWEQRPHFSGVVGQNVTFQVQIEEATGEIYFVYTDTEFGGAQAMFDNGLSAGIGVAGPNQDIATSSNDDTYLLNNSCAHYFYTNCPNPLNYSVTYTTNDEAAITWSAGLAGETDWTIIYGPAGFDPATGGITINTTSSAAIFPGLDDITTYDVYIYADCNPGVLQSSGAFGTFTTLPNCADVTGLAGTSAVDSLFTSWSWVESSGVGTYPSTGFNIQYGFNSFGLYDGSETIVNADNNFTDTTADVTLLAGGVYDIYVQSVCTTDTSNWVGPIQVIMPLDNDSTCFSEQLMVDGSLYVFNNAGATISGTETTIAPPASGCSTTDGWCNSSMNFTTWFTFDAPASGNMRLDATDYGFDGQLAVYEVTDCGDFATYTLVGANDDAIGGGSAAPNWSVCGLTPGNTYYLMHDSWSTTGTGTYSIRLSAIDLEAGNTNGLIDVCLGDTVDLYDGVAGYDMGGVWSEMLPTANFADPLFPSAGLASQVYDFEYRVIDGCAYDTIIQQVEIYGPSSAGNDGTLTVCLNQPFDLLGALSGNVDTGGDWYDPSNNIVPSLTAAGNIPGQFNYDYVTSNGVCPADTANVVVTVDGACDFLGIDEEVFENMTMYPNPTNGSVFITNSGSNEVFNYELTDIKGKVITSATGAINGTETTEVSLDKLVTGFYLIRVYNDNAQKTFRIIKE